MIGKTPDRHVYAVRYLCLQVLTVMMDLDAASLYASHLGSRMAVVLPAVSSICSLVLERELGASPGRTGLIVLAYELYSTVMNRVLCGGAISHASTVHHPSHRHGRPRWLME